MSLSPCVVCGTSDWMALPDPGPQSMASDWRVLPEPLARHACRACGLVRRWPGAAAHDTLYASGYGLYAHAPGDARERIRQDHYAAWVASAVPQAPGHVLDVGCGNGSLLIALAAYWPTADLMGCDPSAESVAHGARAGLRLWQGTAADLPADAVADLVVSVNVIEHTSDPLAFLEALRGTLTPDGRLVLVCPDGGRPGLELLFADHVFSFAAPHLRTLAMRAGLDVLSAERAPTVLGEFQMTVARRSRAPGGDEPALAPVEARSRYLAAWRALDQRLLERIADVAVCFGAGEAAGLLRAYAPRTWARVRACAIDGRPAGGFGELPLIALDEIGEHETVLVAVRPLDQARVAERLRARFPSVATWYDLLEYDSERG
jgi:SAM-dependent methyltransferase